MTSQHGARHSFFGSNRKKKKTKWRPFKLEKQPRISGKYEAFQDEKGFFLVFLGEGRYILDKVECYLYENF